MSMFNLGLGRALCVAMGLAPALVMAQLPVARMAQVFPPGGKAGSTVDVAVAGTDLDEPARLRFSHPGIVGLPKGEGAQFSVTIASNVPPGVHEARFVGRFGVSNPRAFVVGQGTELVAPSTNSAPAIAMPLPFGTTTVNGRAAANAVAWFRFSASAGQRLFIECLAESIDSRMDATLVLADAEGRELKRSRHSGFLDFTAPTKGSWLIGVADFLYRGGPDYFYRLTVSTGPRIDFVLPPAGLPGVTSNFIVFGRNLPGGKPAKGIQLDGQPLEQLPVKIKVPPANSTRLETGMLVRPAEAALDGFEYRVKGTSAREVSNPWLVGIATAPVILETEPNNTAAAAQRITPPCEIAGQFFPAGDVDVFTFEAKKGEVFWIEAISARLGLPTDPFVLLQRVTLEAGGAEKTSDVLELYDSDVNLGDREFNTTSRDPGARFEAPESGTYRLTVRDLFGRTIASPRNVYRLAVRTPAPDFRLVAMTLVPKAKADAKNIEVGVPLLRRGETIAVRVLAFRRDGFNGDIDLSIENAPAGLQFEGDRIEAGKSSDYILLTAADDAPAFAGPVRLVGKARVGDKELVREVRAGTLMFPVASTDSERPESRVTREFDLAITDRESAPLSLTAATNKVWEARVGGKLQIPLAITRRGEFNAALKLKPLGPGNQESLKEFDIEAKATNGTLNLDFAALKLAAGLHVFAVQATTTGKYRHNPEAATAAETAGKEAAKRVAEMEGAAKKAVTDLEKAGKEFTEAEAAAKVSQEKLTAAQAAAENAPDDEKLKSALAEADAAGKEASAKARSATDAKAAAEKAKAAAEAAVKDAKARHDAAVARAKELNERAKPKDVTIVVHSQPIRVRVLSAEQASK